MLICFLLPFPQEDTGKHMIQAQIKCNFIKFKFMLFAKEAVVQRCSANKLFLEISQNSQKNTCARASF